MSGCMTRSQVSIFCRHLATCWDLLSVECWKIETPLKYSASTSCVIIHFQCKNIKWTRSYTTEIIWLINQSIFCTLYKSGVTRCTLFMVLYRYRMCQCWLHAVLWSRIGILMHLIAAEPHSTFIPCRCLCRTILLTLYSMVWDWRVLRAGQMLFYLPKQLVQFLYSTVVLILIFLSIDWHCGAGVFGLYMV